MPKRKERVAPPPKPGGWDLRYATSDAVTGWQYEVTAAGRLWYCIDDQHRTVWLTDATTGHPKATE
jgi:hypothetical protein